MRDAAFSAHQHPTRASTQPAKPSRKTGRFGKAEIESTGYSFPGVPAQPVDPDLPVPTSRMPNKGVRVARRRRLLATAGSQHGLFTVDQARDAGLDRRARHHHLSYGNWRRTAAPRVFRLAGWPPDEHEAVRAWLLWAGPGAAITSFTGLGLLNVIGTGPLMPIVLEVPFERHRAGQRRRSRLMSELPTDRSGVSVHVLPAGPPDGLVVQDGLTIRSPAGALCAAVNSAPSSIALGLAAQLLDLGALSEQELLHAAQQMRCTRVLDVLFERFRAAAQVSQ